jgi:hypothetical protein
MTTADGRTRMAGETKRQRSANYPSMDLPWAEDIIKKAHSQGVMKRTALAQLVGHQDDTSGPARSKLAALKHFGLVDYREGEAIITELGKKVAAPIAGEDVSEALGQSFFNVATFKQTYDLCAKDVILSKETLVNTVIRQVRVSAKAAPDFVDIFASSGVKAGLVEIPDDKSIKLIKEPLPLKKPAEHEPDQVIKSLPPASSLGLHSLTINLQISLPETTNSTVYKEIFEAMKTYLFPGSGK